MESSGGLIYYISNQPPIIYSEHSHPVLYVRTGYSTISLPSCEYQSTLSGYSLSLIISAHINRTQAGLPAIEPVRERVDGPSELSELNFTFIPSPLCTKYYRFHHATKKEDPGASSD